jgi:hypothetical protein
MGTRSRLIIRRRAKRDICVWVHWDGYFSSAGNDICEQIAVLLQRHPEGIEALADAIKVAYHGTPTRTSIWRIVSKVARR